MQVNIAENWKHILEAEFNKDYFKRLWNYVNEEYATNTCYPKLADIFAAFNYCAFKDVKVVILGQDPYHGEGQANGLCFSVHKDIAHPPSLNNIFKELHSDTGKPYPVSGDLSSWASQGVLLLNATLTVRAGEAGSHQKKGWEEFTDAVIREISAKKEGVIFLLWGGFAKKKGKKIDAQKHVVLRSGHPSPLSANRGYWFGNQHFSKVNEILKANNQIPIRW